MFFKRSFGMIFGVLALLAALAGGPALGADWKLLPGHVPAAVNGLNPVGQPDETSQMRLAIGVPLRDPAGLDQFLAQLYDPASPNYRKYLTPEEFTARFGPTEQDYETVKQFALANGLTIVETHDNRLVLDVAGPVVAVERALHITLHTYQHPTEARQFFAPDSEPIVAADLPVADIQGLSDFTKPHPRLRQAKASNSPKSGTGQGGSYMGNDFRNAYAAGTTMTGAGQMVGLVQFDGYYSNDIAAYAAAAGGGRTNIVVQAVFLDGYNGQPTSGGNPEVSLDIEMAMSMAPGLSKIMVFEAGPTGFPNDVLNAMVQNSSVKSLSSSWGWSGGPNATTDNIFKEMASQGQSYFNASGDSDAFTVGASSANGVDNPRNANAPSSSPYVTEVGGTSLAMNGAGASFAGEGVWNWGGGAGSSGGISSFYAIPSWQTGISMTANKGSTTQRNIPDVALTADGVSVYYGHGGSGEFGGTSCAAPLWAGFMALVNQQAASLGNPSAGFINPAIYAIGKGQNASYSYNACFHDTAAGNNFSSASPASYPAVAGYDLCTGWGTPNGVNLINALAGSGSGDTTGSTNTTSGSTNTVTSSTNGFSISPLTGFVFDGAVGGPFAPASGALQLTNDSATSVNWALVSTSAWLTVGSTHGTLAGNSTAGVAVNIGASANALKPGSYSSSLGFTNLATHVVQRIPVTLQIQQSLSVSPLEGFAATGPVGGAFIPSSQNFTLTNLGEGTLKWGLTKAPTWLTVSAAGGSLPAGGQTNVIVSLSTTANTLGVGSYNASLSFTNVAGVVVTVPFTLSISPPIMQNGGFETGTFADWTQSGNKTGASVIRGSALFVHSGIYGAKLQTSGSPGYLSQTPATAPGQTYRLSLWLRNATGLTPNWFQVQWNGTPIFVQQNLTSKNWTNLQFLVTATSASSVLQLGFQEGSSYLGLDDVSLAPVASTSIRTAVRMADDFQLVWNTGYGTVYQAQYKTNLCQPDWINLGTTTTANADTMMMTDTNAFQCSPQRFYRLLAIPPP